MPNYEEVYYKSGIVQYVSDEAKETNDFLRYSFRLGISALLHPLDYAKVLIQLGYEPIPPRVGRSLLGRPILVLPNIFQYTSYIRRVDGFWGCYRGLTPKLLASILGMVFSGSFVLCAGLDVPEDADEDLDDEELYIQFKACLKRDIALVASSVVAAQPLHVISLRMMAQFIGRETTYNTISGSIQEIYRTEGISGFFSGLVPKLLCDVACVVLTSTTVYILNKYVVKDKLGRSYNAGLTQYAFASILYPLQVVANCMAVTGSRLMAGQPPLTPLYGNWFNCFNDLQKRGALKRGSSPIFRSLPIKGSAANTSVKMGLPLISKFY